MISFDIDEKEYFDLISSWWVNIHGHGKKEIIKAINNQLQKFEHVLFTDFTHNSSRSCKRVSFNFTKKNMQKFFSDSSTW